MSGPPPGPENGFKACTDCGQPLPYGPACSAFYRISKASAKVGPSAWQARCKACDKRKRSIARGSNVGKAQVRGVDGEGNGASHEEIGAALGVPAAEVVRIEARAMAKLRQGLEEYYR